MITDYTKKDIKAMNNALKKLKKCNGNCKECEKCHIYFSHINEHYTAFAFGCDNLPQNIFTYLSDTMQDLKHECIESLNFELETN